MTSRIPISFYIAEVVSAAGLETYTLQNQKSNNDGSNHVYEISVKLVSPEPDNPPISPVRPADFNIKKLPLVGEQVLIFRGYQENSNVGGLEPCWYYLSNIAISSEININSITGLSKPGTAEPSPPGRTFKEKTIAPLQAYEGDVLIEGRWGNSIRFGSSIDTSKAKVDKLPNFLGEPGQPIILLSTRNKTTTDFTTEDIETDYASLYLTSKQRINNLKTNNPVNNDKSVSSFSDSQLIGVADRIVLKSKTDSVIVDAKQSIEINAPTIYLGSSDKSNKEAMLHSTAVVKLLQKLVALVKIGFADSSGVVCTPLYDSLPDVDLENLFKQLTNDNIQVDAYKTNSLNT